MKNDMWMGRPIKDLTRAELEEALILALGDAQQVYEWRMEYLKACISVAQQRVNEINDKLGDARASLMAQLDKV